MADRLRAGLRGVKSALAITAVLVAVDRGAGQPGESGNAATWYERSCARLGTVEITEAEWEAIKAYRRDPDAAPSATVRAVLARAEPVLSAARRGAQQDCSDFGLDYAQGFEMLLPHLSPLRHVAQLMAADAKLRLADGSASGAADEIAAIYRLSDHLGSDATIISSLVGQVIFEDADQVAASGIDRAAFGPAESAVMREALAQLGPDDPFSLIGAIEAEKVITIDWMREHYAAAEDRASLLEDWIADPGAEEAVAGLALMDPAQFEAALEGADRTLERVIEAFRMDDPDEARLELQRISAEIESGAQGPLAMFMPAYTRVYDRLLAARQRIAERDGQLAALIAGTIAPEALANAAVLYLQAVEMIGQIDPAELQKLDEVAGQPLQPIAAEPAETLRSAAGVVETLRQAAQMPRCDFSIVYGRVPPVIPDYLAGLRRAGRLLVADAVRMLQEADDEQAADRLEICFRMSAHLAGDEILASSLMAHNVFSGADGLARWALANDAFSIDDRARIFSGVQVMPRKDPFGYVAALRSTRAQILERLRLGGDGRGRAEQLLDQCNGDELLYLLVLADEPPDPAERAYDDEAAGLAGIISAEGLAAARGRAEAARRVIEESGDVRAALAGELPLIGNVNQRQAAARADLRQAYFALQAPAPPK